MILQKDQKLGSTDRFGYEWEKFNSLTSDYEKQFLIWIQPLKKEFFKNKMILDVGCGTGRNSYWPLIYGAREVVGIDYNQKTVSVAKNNLKNFKNFKGEFGSAYNIKYKDTFDLAFSIGVIHHLENPLDAIKNMIKSVKKGGRVSIWVYGYETNEWIVKYVNPVRKITSQLPLPIVDFLALVLTIFLLTTIRIYPVKHPYLKLLSSFKFWHVHSIVFDQLIPRIANYWRSDQALSLLSSFKELKNIEIHLVNGNSWAVSGVRK